MRRKFIMFAAIAISACGSGADERTIVSYEGVARPADDPVVIDADAVAELANAGANSSSPTV